MPDKMPDINMSLPAGLISHNGYIGQEDHEAGVCISLGNGHSTIILTDNHDGVYDLEQKVSRLPEPKELTSDSNNYNRLVIFVPADKMSKVRELIAKEENADNIIPKILQRREEFELLVAVNGAIISDSNNQLIDSAVECRVATSQAEPAIQADNLIQGALYSYNIINIPSLSGFDFHTSSFLSLRPQNSQNYSYDSENISVLYADPSLAGTWYYVFNSYVEPAYVSKVKNPQSVDIGSNVYLGANIIFLGIYDETVDIVANKDSYKVNRNPVELSAYDNQMADKADGSTVTGKSGEQKSKGKASSHKNTNNITRQKGLVKFLSAIMGGNEAVKELSESDINNDLYEIAAEITKMLSGFGGPILALKILRSGSGDETVMGQIQHKLTRVIAKNNPSSGEGNKDEDSRRQDIPEEELA